MLSISIEGCSKVTCHWLEDILNGFLRNIIPLLYQSSLKSFLVPRLTLKAMHTCHKPVQQMHDWVKGHNRQIKDVNAVHFGGNFCVIYPTVVTATMVRQREMFSQMTLAYLRFVTWDWHIRLILFWKIHCWFCRIITRAITGLLWRRTLKRLATYHWLTPTCNVPMAWFRMLLIKHGTVVFWYLLPLLVLPKLIIIIMLIPVLLFYALWIDRALKTSMLCFSQCANAECREVNYWF